MEVRLGLNVLGVLFAMSGSIFEIYGALTSNGRILSEQAASCWGYNPHLYKALVEQRIRAILGFVLILLGFSTQFSSMIISDSYNKTHYIPISILSGIMVFVILLFILISKLLIQRDINYFLIPRELDNLKKSIDKLERLDGKQLKDKKQYIINISNSLSERLELDISVKDDINIALINEIIKGAEKYIVKHNL